MLPAPTVLTHAHYTNTQDHTESMTTSPYIGRDTACSEEAHARTQHEQPGSGIMHSRIMHKITLCDCRRAEWSPLLYRLGEDRNKARARAPCLILHLWAKTIPRSTHAQATRLTPRPMELSPSLVVPCSSPDVAQAGIQKPAHPSRSQRLRCHLQLSALARFILRQTLRPSRRFDKGSALLDFFPLWRSREESQSSSDLVPLWPCQSRCYDERVNPCQI